MIKALTGPSMPACPQSGIRIALGLATAIGVLTQAHAEDNIAWVDWYAKTPTGVLGTITLGEEQVEVTFSGPYYHAFTDVFLEPLWGQATTLATTYLSESVKNPPPNSDSIVIAGGPEDLKLTFSTPFKPFLAIASLGLTNFERSVLLVTTMDFEQDFDILSNGPNFYAGGRFNPFEKRTAGSTNRLLGRESSGVIALRGTLDEINWKSPLREEVDGTLVGTYMFTVGASCDGYDIGPNPLIAAAAVPRGCTAVNKDLAFQQQAALDVRGTLTNRGVWTQGDAVTVADNATLNNNGVYTVGELQTLTIDGTLRNFGQLDVRGTVHLRAGAAADSAGSVVLKGDNTFAQGGRLRIDAESTFSSYGSMQVEASGQLLVGGNFYSSGTLEVRGTLETLASGVIDLAGQGRIEGSLLNRGTLRVGGAGHLIFDRIFDFVGSPAVLDNRGLIVVDEGGTLQITAMGGGSGEVSFLSDVRNKLGGTLQVDGRLQADGTLTNAGRIDLGATGELVGRFTQEHSGVLNAAGEVRAEEGDHIALGGVSHISGTLSVAEGATLDVTAGGRLDVNAFDNAGQFTNAGNVSLNGAAEDDPSFLEHTNSGSLVNDKLFRIERNAFLHDSGEIRNNDRFVVDGTLFAVGIVQGPRGELVNNGTITSPGGGMFGLFVGGGRISGNGTFDSSGVTFGEFEFDTEAPPIEPALPPEIAPGTSPGTLTFTGDLTLTGATTITMEFTEHDGGDRLVVGGQLRANGATMKLVFLGDSAPGLDQIFDFFETPGGLPEDLAIESPAAVRLDYFARGSSIEGRDILGASFADPGSYLLEEAELAAFDFLSNNAFQQRFIEDAIVRPNAFVWNEGTIGVRNLATARLEVQTLVNEAGAELLNSGVIALASLTNRGTVKNRAGAELTVDGSVTNEGGLIDNRGHIRLGGGQNYRQTGADAVTRVDGVLDAQWVEILGGTLTGSGSIKAGVHIGAGAVLAPGNSPGTLSIEGGLYAEQDSEILIEIASDEIYDRVVVTGDATLDGWVRFRLLDGYVPALNQDWQWLEAGGTSFASLLFWMVEAAAADGAYYVLADADGTYDPHRILPRFTQFEFAGDRLSLIAAPVPLPGAWVLFVSGLALMRRKKRRTTGSGTA